MDLIRCLLYLVDVFIWAGPVNIPDQLTLSWNWLISSMYVDWQRIAAIFFRWSLFLTSRQLETLAYSPTVGIRHLKTNPGVYCHGSYLVDVFIWAGPVHIPDPLTLSWNWLISSMYVDLQRIAAIFRWSLFFTSRQIETLAYSQLSDPSIKSKRGGWSQKWLLLSWILLAACVTWSIDFPVHQTNGQSNMLPDPLILPFIERMDPTLIANALYLLLVISVDELLIIYLGWSSPHDTGSIGSLVNRANGQSTLDTWSIDSSVHRANGPDTSCVQNMHPQEILKHPRASLYCRKALLKAISFCIRRSKSPWAKSTSFKFSKFFAVSLVRQSSAGNAWYFVVFLYASLPSTPFLPWPSLLRDYLLAPQLSVLARYKELTCALAHFIKKTLVGAVVSASLGYISSVAVARSPRWTINMDHS